MTQPYLASGLIAISLMMGAARAEPPLAVIANRNVPVSSLMAEEVTQIFLKRSLTWPDGQPIRPVDIKEGEPLKAEFYARVTGRGLAQLRSYWARQAFTGVARPPREVASADDVLELVEKTNGAVGYTRRFDDSVKVLLSVGK